VGVNVKYVRLAKFKCGEKKVINYKIWQIFYYFYLFIQLSHEGSDYRKVGFRVGMEY
jgi:hypothetical protein